MTSTTAPAARPTEYISGASNPLWDAGLAWDINMGLLTTPATNYIAQLCRYPFWAADNGAYKLGASHVDFNHAGWWKWIQKVVASVSAPTLAACRYATAPDAIDVSADGFTVTSYPELTLAWAAEWLPQIKSLGLPAAMVIQPGMESMIDQLPWDLLDAVFIGGDNEFKLGEAARILVAEAKARGKYVHMGRVNSSKRLSYASSIGCDSADGTFLGKGPAKNLPRLMDWADVSHTPGTGVVCGNCSHWVADRRKGAAKGAQRRIQVRHASAAAVRYIHTAQAA